MKSMIIHGNGHRDIAGLFVFEECFCRTHSVHADHVATYKLHSTYCRNKSASHRATVSLIGTTVSQRSRKRSHVHTQTTIPTQPPALCCPASHATTHCSLSAITSSPAKHHIPHLIRQSNRPQIRHSFPHYSPRMNRR